MRIVHITHHIREATCLWIMQQTRKVRKERKSLRRIESNKDDAVLGSSILKCGPGTVVGHPNTINQKVCPSSLQC